MASAGQWETVRKVNKKGKAPSQSHSKSQKKALIENMPRIEAAPPVKESSTIYDAFNAKEKSQQAVNNVNNKENRAGGDQSPNSKKIKRRPEAEKKDKHLSLEEAVRMIEVTELETMLAKDEATFPESPSVWLKDLASVLNLKMDKVPEKDPVFQNMPRDYPVNLLPEKVKKILKKTLAQCSSKTLELFFEHCVQSMINDMGKGISTYGYRMFIQLILFDRPDIITGSLKKYLDMLKANTNRPLRCLSIMWAVGQAGVNNLGDGLIVWLEVMLPVLNIRALAPYGVEYLEKLFSLHHDLKPGYNSIGFRGFFPVLDLIFSQQNIPSNLQKKMQALYPKIKAIAFGGEPENNLRAFFPSFLARCLPSCNKQLKQELLDCLVTCLTVDKQCFSVWRQMYTKHLTPSSLLLSYLVENWEKVNRKLEKKLLKETINAFSVTNEELHSKYNSDEGYKVCVSACKDLPSDSIVVPQAVGKNAMAYGVKGCPQIQHDENNCPPTILMELQTKMSKMRFPWRFMFLLILVSFVGVIGYDVHINKGFKNSRTCQILTDSGILVFLEQVWNRIKIYTAKTMVWLQENVPIYYAKACDFAGPYLQLFWEKLYALCVYIVEVTAPVRAWLNEEIPLLLEWVQSKVPGLWSACGYYFDIVWKFVVHYSLIFWENAAYVAHIVHDWLLKNVLIGNFSPENIQKTFTEVLATVQSSIVTFLQWCTNQVGAQDTAESTPPQTAGTR